MRYYKKCHTEHISTVYTIKRSFFSNPKSSGLDNIYISW